MNDKLKKVGGTVIVAVLIIIGGIWFVFGGPEHIEDTNGDRNYTLQKITNRDIIKNNMGSVGGPNEKNELFSDLPVYCAKKYTGVSEIYRTYIVKGDFVIDIYNYYVEEGNFKMVLLVDDKIVHEFDRNETMQNYVLEDITGEVSLRIAGESAKFEFSYSAI